MSGKPGTLTLGENMVLKSGDKENPTQEYKVGDKGYLNFYMYVSSATHNIGTAEGEYKHWWNPDDSTPITDSLPTEGRYVLESNITISDTLNIASGKTLNLCLNGYSIIKQGDGPLSMLKRTQLLISATRQTRQITLPLMPTAKVFP